MSAYWNNEFQKFETSFLRTLIFPNASFFRIFVRGISLQNANNFWISKNRWLYRAFDLICLQLFFNKISVRNENLKNSNDLIENSSRYSTF